MGARLRAKPEKIVFDTIEGKKEYELKSIKNKQLMEIAVLADSGNLAKSATLMAKYSLNEGPGMCKCKEPNIEKRKCKECGKEEPFTDEEIEDTEAVFLMKILKSAAKVNGMKELFDFQLKAGLQLPHPTNPLQKSGQASQARAEDILNQNPRKKL